MGDCMNGEQGHFDYSKYHIYNKVCKVEKFSDVPFRITNYTILTEVIVDSATVHYIIELENKDKGLGLQDIYNKNVWKAIKNYFEIGTEVKASGRFYYNESGELVFIRIEGIEYNSICIAGDENSPSKININTGNNALKDKRLVAMIIAFILLGYLMMISAVIAGILLLIDVISLVTYCVIRDKRMAKYAEQVFEQAGLRKIDQPHIEVKN